MDIHIDRIHSSLVPVPHPKTLSFQFQLNYDKVVVHPQVGFVVPAIQGAMAIASSREI